MRIALVLALVAGCSPAFGKYDATAVSNHLTQLTKDVVDDALPSFANPDVTTITIDHVMPCDGGGSIHITGVATGTSVADGGDGTYNLDITTEIAGCQLPSGIAIDAPIGLTTSGTIMGFADAISLANFTYRGELVGDGASCKVDLTVALSDPGPVVQAMGLVCGTSIDYMVGVTS